MIIIQILAFFCGILASMFLTLDTIAMFYRHSLEVIKDIMFSSVVIILCAAITGVIQLNLNSTGMF